MVTITFRSRLRDPQDPDYPVVAERMLALAERAPGFVSFKHFEAEDGERLSLIEFDSSEAAEAWRADPKHRVAQQQGREHFYSEYHIDVYARLRAYSFDGRTRSERGADAGDGTPGGRHG